MIIEWTYYNYAQHQRYFGLSYINTFSGIESTIEWIASLLRTTFIGPEDRVTKIPTESRSTKIPFEDRTTKIGG